MYDLTCFDENMKTTSLNLLDHDTYLKEVAGIDLNFFTVFRIQFCMLLA